MANGLTGFHRRDRTEPASKPAAAQTGKRRLGDLQALVLIGVLFMIPIGVLLYDLFSLKNAHINRAEKEVRGLRINAELRDLQQALMAHRAPARQVADGVGEARAEQQKILATVKKDIEDTGKIVELLGGEFGVLEEWRKAKADWQKYEAGAATLKGQQVIEIHNLV